MHLWIFRLIFFSNTLSWRCPIHFSRSREKGGRIGEVPCFAAGWLSLCWLCRSISLHLTDFPTFWVLVYEDWGVSFIPVNVCICRGGGWWSKGKQLGFGSAFCPSLYNMTEVTPLFLCTWSLHEGRPATRTPALKQCCHYPPSACPARFGIDWIRRPQDSEAGDAAARFLWKQKWELRDD